MRTGEALPKPEGAKGMTAINSDTTKAHAELGAMNQSYKDGNVGGKATLTVEGQDVCKYCRQDIKKMSKCLELDELVVHEKILVRPMFLKGHQLRILEVKRMEENYGSKIICK